MLVQEYSSYTAVDHAVWQTLYKRQIGKVGQVAYSRFGKSLQELGILQDSIPEFGTMNIKLQKLTGWQIYAVPGLIPNDLFFTQMSGKRFGATTWIRKPEELDYLEEPDMFHDIFGHIPLLADPCIATFLQELARIAVKFMHSETAIEAIARLYWYTIEFGLVLENGTVKIYGAGILSSIGETEFCLSDKATRLPFHLEEVLSLPYIKDSFQQQYFVLENMEQLMAAARRLELFLELAAFKN